MGRVPEVERGKEGLSTTQAERKGRREGAERDAHTYKKGRGERDGGERDRGGTERDTHTR